MNKHSRSHPKYVEDAMVVASVFRVMEKASEQIIILVLVLTLHTIVAYAGVTANTPLVMKQGRKINKLQKKQIVKPFKIQLKSIRAPSLIDERNRKKIMNFERRTCISPYPKEY